MELVLIIFRRLAEDIHLYDSGLDQRRKKEMSTALNEEIKTVFRFLLQNMEVSCKYHINNILSIEIEYQIRQPCMHMYLKFKVQTISVHKCHRT